METEANPIMQRIQYNNSKSPTNKKNGNGIERELEKENKEPDMKTRFNLLKKMKNELEEVKKKENPYIDDDEDVEPKKNTHSNAKKEFVMKRLIEAKRKKLIQEKYERNGKNNEVIKEGNESEEESSSTATPIKMMEKSSSVSTTNEFVPEDKVKRESKVENQDVEEESDNGDDEDLKQKEEIKQKILRLALERKAIKEKMEQAKIGTLKQQGVNENEDKSATAYTEDTKENEDEKESSKGTNSGVGSPSTGNELKNVIEILKSKKDKDEKKDKNGGALTNTSTSTHSSIALPPPKKETVNIEEMSFREKLKRLKELQKREFKEGGDIEIIKKVESKRKEDLQKQEEIKKEKEECQKKIEEEETSKKFEEEKKKKLEEKKKKKFEKVDDIKHRRIESDFRARESGLIQKQIEPQKLEKRINDIPKVRDPIYQQIAPESYQKRRQFSNIQEEEAYRRQNFHNLHNYSQSELQFKVSKKPPVQNEEYKYSKDTLQKEVQTVRNDVSQVFKKPVNIIYSPKKPTMRGASNDKLSQTLTNYEPNNVNNYSMYLNHNHQLSEINNYDNMTMKTQSQIKIKSINPGMGYYNNTMASYTHNFNTNNCFSSQHITNHSDNLTNYSYYNKSYTYDNLQKDTMQVNLEDLMILEEKLTDIILAINSNQNIRNECFEWWNYYFNCSFFNYFDKAFVKDDKSMRIIRSNKYELLSILLCYDISLDPTLFQHVLIMLKAILSCNHSSLITKCEYILSKVSAESMNNIWVFKLRNLVESSKINNSTITDESLSYIDQISYNTERISNDIRIILKNYNNNTAKAENLISLYRNIESKSYQQINQFFQEQIMKVDNPNASVLACVVLRESGKFQSEMPPYLKTKNLKPYSLVLDLDETILHFKPNPNNENEGILRVRPGINEFLEGVSPYYEIIVFTAATQEYADTLIDEIEETKIYFDYRLYRQHTIIIDNDFVKDLSRIGRPIDKIIIVDNMPQNFRLQKENGIIIRAFLGEDPDDRALIDLKDILIKIAKDGGDVRKSIFKYKEDIIEKVSSNFSKSGM